MPPTFFARQACRPTGLRHRAPCDGAVREPRRGGPTA